MMTGPSWDCSSPITASHFRLAAFHRSGEMSAPSGPIGRLYLRARALAMIWFSLTSRSHRPEAPSTMMRFGLSGSTRGCSTAAHSCSAMLA